MSECGDSQVPTPLLVFPHISARGASAGPANRELWCFLATFLVTLKLDTSKYLEIFTILFVSLADSKSTLYVGIADAHYWAPPHRSGRPDPSIRLLPRVFDGEALIGPG